jgi:protein TonB
VEPPVQTEHYTPIVIKPDNEVVTPPPSLADLEIAQVGLKKIEGEDFDGTVRTPILEDPKGIITERDPEPEGPLGVVQVEAKFDGDWKRFLEKNLNPQVALDNNAPPGLYTVLVQFVVDIDGTISDIKTLNNPGYGLEQEAIRVIKKSKKWEPAIQNGRTVKAYRKQPITFRITDDY